MPTEEFPNLHILDHPLITHKLSIMRHKNTPTVLFRLLLKEISMLMGYEITRPLALTTKPIETPLVEMDAPVLDEPDVAIVSILRAGLGMSEGVHELMPTAREGHVGLYRDPETKRPVEYYVKLPSPAARPYILVPHAGDWLFRRGRGRRVEQARRGRQRYPDDDAGLRP